MMRGRCGFTLIELLIVVSVLGLLAALGALNYQESLLRAKISKSMSNMKTIAIAIEQLRIDRGVILVDWRDGMETEWGIRRIREEFNGVGGGSPYDRTWLDVYKPLTSPVSYLSTIPRDSFIPPNYVAFADETPGMAHRDEYHYTAHDPEAKNHELGSMLAYFQPPIHEGHYVLWGCSPGHIKDYQPEDGAYLQMYGVPYHASNGIVSGGEIIYHSGNGFIEKKFLNLNIADQGN